MHLAVSASLKPYLSTAYLQEGQRGWCAQSHVALRLRADRHQLGEAAETYRQGQHARVGGQHRCLTSPNSCNTDSDNITGLTGVNCAISPAKETVA